MFDKPESNPDFPKLEEDILKIWEERDVFARSIRGEKDFVFYDGPPFATGTPHYGHLLAGTLKDVVPRPPSRTSPPGPTHRRVRILFLVQFICFLIS